MFLRKVLLLLFLFMLAIAPSIGIAAEDMTGTQDHPLIPRLADSIIYGYEYSDYDRGKFLTMEEGQFKLVTPEGKRTRIMYIAPDSYTVAGVFANYRTALAELGEVQTIYSCEQDCPNDLATNLVWQKDNRIPINLRGSQYLYQVGNAMNFASQGYAYATITNDQAKYHFSVYTALFVKGGIFRMDPDVTGYRSVHVEIVEEAGFNPTLEVVTPDEIVEGISEEGRIALYGIYFDFDSDQLKPDSSAALEAIAAALEASPDMKIYVVGHTDNQGTYDYNLDLSKRRAASVVKALTGQFGLAADRLMAVGVGPVSPIASNRTEQGQALNRRVELVER